MNLVPNAHKAFRWCLAAAAVAAITAAAASARAPGAADAGVLALGVAGRANAHPSIAAAGDFVAVAWQAAQQGGGGDVVVATSRDGGATFGAPVRVNRDPGEARNGGEMPPRVVLVPSPPAATPEIVVVWRARQTVTSIRAASSRDGGATFGVPETIQSPSAVGERGWQTVAVAADGRVHAVWLDHRGLAAASASSHAHHKAGAGPAMDGVAMAQKSGLYFTTLASGVAERELAKGVCYCCKTTLAAGPGDTLFAAWRHVYDGNVRDIAFIASRDNGRTFGPPARVSEDKWQIAGCPDDGPAMAVDAAGTAHIVWPTVVGGSDAPEGALFYATGDVRAFSPRLRVPTSAGVKPAHPQIVLTPDRRAVVAWDESRDGVRRAFVSASNGAGAFLTAEAVTDDVTGSYPMMAVARDRLLVVWTRGSGDAATIGVRRLPLPRAGS